jgi:glucose-1-phosphate cytidylyltransferase
LGDGGRINGGFFVFETSFLDRIKNDSTVLEQEPLKSLAEDGQLAAYSHDGFWQPMDTVRDRNHLESLWTSGKAPWKVWS